MECFFDVQICGVVVVDFVEGQVRSAVRLLFVFLMKVMSKSVSKDYNNYDTLKNLDACFLKQIRNIFTFMQEVYKISNIQNIKYTYIQRLNRSSRSNKTLLPHGLHIVCRVLFLLYIVYIATRRRITDIKEWSFSLFFF